MLNPIRIIMQSKSPRGIKIIALSLLLVLVSAVPIILYSGMGMQGGNPMVLSWIFAVGAIVAHVGFLVGILFIIWDMYFARK